MEDIKQMLLEGKTFDELMNQFVSEVKATQNEIEAEKAKQDQDAQLDKSRTIMVGAIVDYMMKLGVIDPEDFTNEDLEELEQAIKAGEQQYRVGMQAIHKLKNELSGAKQGDCHSRSVKRKSSVVDEDKILADFLAQFA